MPRKLRVVPDGSVVHVINRRVGKLELFEKELDYAAFEKAVDEAHKAVPMRVLSYCLMPNHWHLLAWPKRGADLPRFMHRLTLTHMRRWHAHRESAGTGPVYQGRYKSFPVQEDGHLLTVARYVERNAMRAGLASRAEEWRWGSLWRREGGTPAEWMVEVKEWPVKPRGDWVEEVNEPQTSEELEAIRVSVNRGAPFGSRPWQLRTAAKLKLTQSMRDPWRPRKAPDGKKGRASGNK